MENTLTKAETVIEAFMRLDPEGRERAMQTISAFMGVSTARALAPQPIPTGEGMSAMAEEGDAFFDAPPEAEVAEQFLAQIADLDPYERFKSIQSALGEVATDEASAVLIAARREILENHPIVGFRAGVVRFGKERPAELIVACVGAIAILVTWVYNLF